MPTEMFTLAKGVEIQSSLCWCWGLVQQLNAFTRQREHQRLTLQNLNEKWM